MKIAIHQKNKDFSSQWIEYCQRKLIDYKVVNCYENDIIQKLGDCDALMWHFDHANAKDFLFAKQLLSSLEKPGKKIFPNIDTAWHFDDKIAQKYLLEAIGAPLVPTHVFYDKSTALRWIDHTTFPKVFKLRRGAGAAHVQLIKNKRSARKIINKAFGRGFRQYQPISNLRERIRKYKIGNTDIKDVIKGIIRLGYTTNFDRVAGREKGYVYFQDFIPHSDHDIRVVVIGDKAFAIKRMVREGDFRASGSGFKQFDKDLFDEELICLAFKIAQKIKSSLFKNLSTKSSITRNFGTGCWILLNRRL